MSDLITPIFQGPMSQFFEPINEGLTPIYMPWARIVAVAFFILTMIWVGAILNREYVHVSRPNNKWYSDLRIWTVGSMLPHIIVYLYF
ncbi:MAG: hypothetical protein ACLFTT_13855 [Candidatus Hydrogenedentota bacterium]